MKPTVLIITKNEAVNIVSVIRSCGDMPSEVVVVDSGSQDETQKLAKEIGAIVYEKEFINFSDQLNYGISKVSNEWVFVLDADERPTLELINRIRTLKEDGPTSAYLVPRKNYFLGQWIRWSGWYPDYSPRIFNKNLCYFQRAVHQELVISGPRVKLKESINHFSYISMEQYMKKLILYTRLEAEDSSLGNNRIQRQMSFKLQMKRIFRRMPGRPVIRFVWMYFIRLGFLDGRKGYELAILSMMYEYVSIFREREAVEITNLERKSENK